MPRKKIDTSAIKSGIIPKLRDNTNRPNSKLTKGEQVIRFIETYVYVPEGELVGNLMQLDDFQKLFILALFDGKVPARRAILSVGRKNGKTALIAALLLAFMFMDSLTTRNSRINSAALSRDQAALIFNYMQKSIMFSEILQSLSKITPSFKKITAFNTGIEFSALAADAGRAMGLSPSVFVGDEWGQIIGPSNAFVDALMTSQGAHKNPLAIIISTQAPSDADFLSIMIDDATRSPSDSMVCHVYAADKDCDLLDEAQWKKSSPALGRFRSIEDIRQQAEQAKRLPTSEAAFRNLILNQRVALDGLWLAPEIWKSAGKPIDKSIFSDGRMVTIGLDLSLKIDLTAAVLAVKDDEQQIHLWPLVFTPLDGIKDRENRDKAPYTAWVNAGFLIAVPGKIVDYEFVFSYIKKFTDEAGIHVNLVNFDRWRINEAKTAADRTGFSADEWRECGQGYKSMSPMIEAFEQCLFTETLRHGNHPLLNMAASAAQAVSDPTGNRKLEKTKSTNRIDVLIASLMAVEPLLNSDAGGDVSWWIG